MCVCKHKRQIHVEEESNKEKFISKLVTSVQRAAAEREPPALSPHVRRFYRREPRAADRQGHGGEALETRAAGRGRGKSLSWTLPQMEPQRQELARLVVEGPASQSENRIPGVESGLRRRNAPGPGPGPAEPPRTAALWANYELSFSF